MRVSARRMVEPVAVAGLLEALEKRWRSEACACWGRRWGRRRHPGRLEWCDLVLMVFVGRVGLAEVRDWESEQMLPMTMLPLPPLFQFHH